MSKGEATWGCDYQRLERFLSSDLVFCFGSDGTGSGIGTGADDAAGGARGCSGCGDNPLPGVPTNCPVI